MLMVQMSHPSDPPGSILFVVDAPDTRSALIRSLGGAGFLFRFASGAEEAMSMLAGKPAELVVADSTVQGVQGAVFLERVRQAQPSAARVILSGQADHEAAIHALAIGAAKTYFPKPWNDESLRNRIRHVLEVHRQLRTRGLLELITGTAALPAVPAIYLRLREAIEQGKSSAQLAAIVECDVALVSKVLQVINSALYGRSGVTSVERAIGLLGIDIVRGLSLLTAFEARAGWRPSQRSALERIVAHSVIVQHFTVAVIPSGPDISVDLAAAAGLLHDAGQLLLLDALPQRMQAIEELMATYPHYTFTQAEAALGFEETSHAKLGGYLLDDWNLPEPIVDTALFHHEPDGAADQSHRLVSAVAWVDAAVSAARRRVEPSPPPPDLMLAEKAPAVMSGIVEAVIQAGL
jgi:HD-like signal output (HDOD) protein/ActR/RegA family two-component response regulator